VSSPPPPIARSLIKQPRDLRLTEEFKKQKEPILEQKGTEVTKGIEVRVVWTTVGCSPRGGRSLKAAEAVRASEFFVKSVPRRYPARKSGRLPSSSTPCEFQGVGRNTDCWPSIVPVISETHDPPRHKSDAIRTRSRGSRHDFRFPGGPHSWAGRVRSNFSLASVHRLSPPAGRTARAIDGTAKSQSTHRAKSTKLDRPV
jgi:hypothetical protein